MNKIPNLAIAIAIALAASTGTVQAAPVFGDGLNNEFFNNFENQYRLLDNCTEANPCFTVDAANDPAGYAKAVPAGIPVTQSSTGFYSFDPTSTALSPINNVIQGDLFVGILNIQNIDNLGSTTWFSSATDQFTGYFVQQVDAVFPDEGGPATYAHIKLVNPTADPFGILDTTAGEMIRLYTDGATPFESNGTTYDDITKATDGLFWAALGTLAADALDAGSLGDPFGTLTDGYAYSHIDIAENYQNFSDQEAFLALNVVTLGDAYNKGTLAPINDLNENEVGGIGQPPLTGNCNPGSPGIYAGDVGLTTNSCNHFVGTSELEANADSIINAGFSPWLFASNDPFINYREQVPEPSTLVLLGLGFFGLTGIRRYRKRG